MENKTITEIVTFQIKLGVAEENTIEIIDDVVNNFHKKQEGFINGELVKGEKENEWSMIYHYQSMENIKAVGEKIAQGTEMDKFKEIVMPESVKLQFLKQILSWVQ